MDLVVTESFTASYDALNDDEARLLDEVIALLLSDHVEQWARRNLVAGDGSGIGNSAWFIRVPVHNRVFNLYWRYYTEQEIVLLGLVEI